MYKRNRVAIIVGLIVLGAAMILRWRLYYAPAAEDEVYWLDVLQQGWADNLAPDDTTTPAALTTALTNIVAEPTTVTPDQTSRSTYQPTVATALVTGVQPTVVATTSGYAVGFLFGERYVVKQYNAEWQPQADDSIIADGLHLIAGQLPFTHFSYTGSAFVLIYAASNDYGKIDLYSKQFSDFTAIPEATRLVMANLDSDTTIQAAVSSAGMAVVLTAADQSSRLLTFTPQGGGVAEVPLQVMTAATVIGDVDSWVVFGQTNQGMVIQKLSGLGVVQQTVNLTLAEVATTSGLRLVNVKRFNSHLALLFDKKLFVLADNLTALYGDYTFTSDQLYPQVTLQNEQLVLAYATPLSLTEYQVQLQTWPLVTPAR